MPLLPPPHSPPFITLTVILHDILSLPRLFFVTCPYAAFTQLLLKIVPVRNCTITRSQSCLTTLQPPVVKRKVSGTFVLCRVTIRAVVPHHSSLKGKEVGKSWGLWQSNLLTCSVQKHRTQEENRHAEECHYWAETYPNPLQDISQHLSIATCADGPAHTSKHRRLRRTLR